MTSTKVSPAMRTQHPDIAALLDLQEIDVEIRQLQDQLNQYPSIWDEVKEGLRQKSQRVEALAEAEKKREAERRKIEQELRLSADKLKQYQSQQMMVKTSKELTAISQQIDALKKNVQKLEERGMALLQEAPAHKAELEAAEKELAEAKEHARAERDRIREQVNTKKARIEAVKKDRVKAASRVSPEAMQQYELTLRRWNENPVVPVRNGSCTGCHFAILPNKLVELHKATSIEHCDNCGRILSYDETFDPSAE